MSEFRYLGESDWEDEDLLTHEEAGTRLREEVDAELAVIEAVEREGASAAMHRTRLAAMRRRLEHIDSELQRGVGTVRRLGTG